MSNPSRRILIADDHEAVRRGVRSIVETRAHWHVVAEAANGHQALAAARESKPDIAILDFSLPLLNGLDVTRAIRRELPGCEILVFTMYDREDVIGELLRAGARGYVLKSDSQRHLVAAVDALAVRRPYFSSAISETLLDKFLRKTSTVERTLTGRERQVVQLIAEGRLNREIAELLAISLKTVETHRAAAMRKLRLRTTAELVRYAVRNNIVEA